MTIILGILLNIAVLYLIYLLHALYDLQQQLDFLEKNQTNKELRTESRNPLLVKIVLSVNKILRKNKQNREQLIAENQQIDQAINNISHDLRTPLTVAVGYAQYLQAENVETAESQEMLKNISSNLAIVEQRLERLLDYNRLNEHRIQPQPEYFNLSEMLKETMLNMYDSFTSKAFNVQLEIEPNVFVVQDKEQTARILQNIMGNILVHGKEYTTIQLHKNVGKKICHLEISNGLPQPIKHPERLTERFYTEDLSRQTENSGMGLYIVTKLVELQNGKMAIQTTETDFLIRIEFKTSMGE